MDSMFHSRSSEPDARNDRDWLYGRAPERAIAIANRIAAIIPRGSATPRPAMS
jgi:hypothetical protein